MEHQVSWMGKRVARTASKRSESRKFDIRLGLRENLFFGFFPLKTQNEEQRLVIANVKWKAAEDAAHNLSVLGNVLQIPMAGIDKRMMEFKRQYGDVFTLWLPYPTVIISGHEVFPSSVFSSSTT